MKGPDQSANQHNCFLLLIMFQSYSGLEARKTVFSDCEQQKAETSLRRWAG